MPDIGETLREARMRRRIDIAEVESATKIRAKYLRALENEDWDLLPGATYVKTFMRSYAEYLELDGRRMVDEYKRRFEHPRGGEAAFGGLAPHAQQRRDRRRRPPAALGPIVAVGGIAVALLAALYALGKLWPSDSGDHSTAARPVPTPTPHASAPAHHHRHHAAHKPKKLELRLVATGDVYVCLVDGSGKALVPGLTLHAGQRSSKFRGRRFRVNLGTNAVRMVVDGRSYPVAASANPIGYELRAGHKPRRLPDSERPACT